MVGVGNKSFFGKPIHVEDCPRAVVAADAVHDTVSVDISFEPADLRDDGIPEPGGSLVGGRPTGGDIAPVREKPGAISGSGPHLHVESEIGVYRTDRLVEHGRKSLSSVVKPYHGVSPATGSVVRSLHQNPEPGHVRVSEAAAHFDMAQHPGRAHGYTTTEDSELPQLYVIVKRLLRAAACPHSRNGDYAAKAVTGYRVTREPHRCGNDRIGLVATPAADQID